MKTTKTAAMTSAVLATSAAALLTASPASAYTTVRSFGMQQDLPDATGMSVTGWTVSDLRPSDDQIPHPVAGQLWEATTTATAVQGTVTPVITDFNARAESGQNYRALFTVPTTQGVNPTPLTQGNATTGGVYFDVVGPAPDSVVFSNGVEDLLIWT
ncbi:MPT63 family protein [Mycolicibacterium sp. XJ870]